MAKAKSDVVYARTGRRKSAVARVRISPGKGKMTVNSRDYKDYFGRTIDQKIVEKPFEILESSDYDILASVHGRWRGRRRCNANSLAVYFASSRQTGRESEP